MVAFPCKNSAPVKGITLSTRVGRLSRTHFELGFSVNASITLGRKARNRRAQRSVKTVWFNFVCSGTRKDDRTLSAAASQL